MGNLIQLHQDAFIITFLVAFFFITGMHAWTTD
jgi:hypothetical protein